MDGKRFNIYLSDFSFIGKGSSKAMSGAYRGVFACSAGSLRHGIFERLSPDETDHETEIFVLKSIHFTIKPHTVRNVTILDKKYSLVVTKSFPNFILP